MINWKNLLTLFQLTLGYGLLCVYLPSLCLHDWVKEKSLSYRFIFYQVCANMYLILWGFVLAYLKCFNALTLWLTLVMLPLTATAWRKRERVAAHFLTVREIAKTILMGMYGVRALWHDIVLSLRRRCGHIYRRCTKDRILELVGLCLLCVLILVLFGQYHLTRDGFAYGDENVHFYWEQELLHGNAFPAGLYPHGMHFLVAALSSMFGLPLSRTSLTFGCFNACLLFCILYLLLKETFSSKAAVLIGIIFFLISDIFDFSVYWRYQAALPLEWGIIPYCLMFYALLRYVASRDRRDLLLFVLCVGWCIHAHFYAAIIAALTCVAFGIVFLFSMLKKKVFLRIVAGGLLGILLGVLPFGVGIALGFPFQDSVAWEMGDIGSEADTYDVNTLQDDVASIGHILKDLEPEELLNSAYRVVKRPAGRVLMLGLNIGMLLWGLLGVTLSWGKRSHYLLLLFWSAVNWLIALGASTGMLTLIMGDRFAVFVGILSVPLFVFPVQLLYDAAIRIRLKPRHAELGLAAASLIFFFFMVKDGYMKKDFTVETNIVSEGDVKTCYRLMEEYPNKSWSIVSTTFDLSLVRYYGYHFEIIDLLKYVDSGIGSLHLPLGNDSIYMPTHAKDLFIVVETKISQYESDQIRGDSHIGSNILDNRGDPTPELALMNLPETDLLSSSKIYAYPWRAVVMSKLYYWMEKVKETYPNEVSVFYQDETVTVYHIRQDEYFPLDLMLDYQSGLR